ncbi:MAG: LamG-like jellyroll fold domain-containing protein [Crocinitomicaceae bacterium]
MKKVIFLLVFFNAAYLCAQPFGNVAVFDGANDFFDAPDAFTSDFDTAVTVEAWINPCVTNGYRVIASKWYCTGDENGFFFSVFNGKLRFTWDTDACSNGSNTYQSNNSVVATNQWQHVAVAHDSTGVQLYLNGVAVPSSLIAGSVYSKIQKSNQKLRIGAYRIGSTSYAAHFEGLMDEVRIWKTKRTASEIATDYLTSLTGTQSNLVGYYKMNITNSGAGIVVPNSATSTALAVQGTTVGTLSTPLFNSQDYSVLSSILGNDTTVCSTAPNFNLDATVVGAQYLWNDGSTVPTKSVSTSGTYSVIITIGCNEYYDTIQISFQTPPNVNLGSDTTLCIGQSIVLDATDIGASYLWQDAAIASTYFVNSAGNYHVTVLKNSCSNSDTITVSYVSPATVNLGPDQLICQGNSLTLDASNSSATYLWSTTATTPTISVNQTDIYSVEVNHYCGVVKDTVSITVNPLPIVSLGNDTTLCTGESLVLDGTVSGATYAWQDGSTGAHFTVNSAGTYSVTTTKDGCSVSDDIVVSYIAPASVNLGADQTMCQGGSVILDATNTSATYLWSTAAITPTISVNQTGVYSVEVDHYCGIVKDTVSITVNPLPIVSLGNDTTLCIGESLVLDGTVSGATYVWQDGSTGAHFTVNSAGTYSVTTTKDGCSVSDDIAVTFQDLQVDLGPDVLLCEGENFQLSAGSPASTYIWQDGSITDNFIVTSPGLYFVKVNNSACEVIDSIEVKYEILNKNVTVTAVPNCGFSDLLVAANPVSNNGSVISPLHWTIENNYQFLGNSGGKRFTEAGTYNVELSAVSGGCQIDTNFSVYVNIFDLPEVEFNVSNDKPEVEESIYLTNYSNGGLSYTWDFGNGETSNEFEPIVKYNKAETYSISLTVDNDQCSASSDMLVFVKEPTLYYIPNAFSPDGNQFNNTFMPVFTSGYDPYDYEFRIFNRWGEILFISNDSSIGWDGTYNSELQNSGVYIWEVVFGQVDNSRRISERGTVTLVK